MNPAPFTLAAPSSLPHNPGTALVGTAGWALTNETASCFPSQGTQLERYAATFGAVEINSSFYRPHMPETYARWAASVPEGFRFAVKLPRAITHYARLNQVDEPLARFAAQAGALGDKLGCVLVQLPPSGKFDAAVAEHFFTQLQRNFSCMLACEARHPSWFEAPASALLQAQGITRVQADPPQEQAAAFEPTTAAAYVRLHGSPRMYYSSYPDALLIQQTQTLAERAQAGHTSWLIFDNTAAGAAQRNALTVRGAWPCATTTAEQAPQPELVAQAM